MAARKLTTLHIAELKQLAASMTESEDASAKEIADAWNASHDKARHITPRTVIYHLLKLRKALLRDAEDQVKAITDRTVARLASVALTDPRAIATWENGKVKVRNSSEISESEAASVALKVTGKGKNRRIEISYDPNVPIRASRELLSFLHGSRISVTESGAIIARLTESGDREGLERIASGEDPVRVLIDRAPFLSAEEAEDEAAP